MSDFAFNNYCIHCDKECLTNSVYCSDECYSLELQVSIKGPTANDESTSSTTQSNFSSSASSHTHQQSSTSSTTNLSPNDGCSGLVSPLLTPALYLQQQLQLQQQQQQQLNHSPSVGSTLLVSDASTDEYDDDYYDLNYFDLNYSVRSNTNYTNLSAIDKSKQQEFLNSTSHNYRKWLTTTAL